MDWFGFRIVFFSLCKGVFFGCLGLLRVNSFFFYFVNFIE